MKTKYWIVFHTIIGISGFINAYLAYKNGNIDATYAWVVAGGGFLGIAGQYLEKLNED